MATRSMDENLQDHFQGEKEEILDYYNRWFSRPEIERLAKINDIDLDEDTIRDDCETLYDEGVLDEFHRYVAALDGIGPSTIIDAIKQINRDRMEELSTEDMESKSALILYLYEWGWEENLDYIQTLKTYKNKRTYSREAISGERRYESINDDVLEQLRVNLREEIESANSRRKYKARLKSVHKVEDYEIMVEIYVEYKAGSFRQFKFREEENMDFNSERGREVEPREYWPITTRYIHVDYLEDEYDHDIGRSEEDFLEPVMNTLYDNVQYGEDIRFVDPVQYPEKTPSEFVEERVEDQKQEIEEDETLDDNQKEEYKEILENLSTAEQTALTLENVNVTGDLQRITIETGETIESFAEGNNLESQLEKFNEESQHREYTLRIGDREIQVKGVKIEILGDVSKEEEEMITAVLREEEKIKASA